MPCCYKNKRATGSVASLTLEEKMNLYIKLFVFPCFVQNNSMNMVVFLGKCHLHYVQY